MTQEYQSSADYTNALYIRKIKSFTGEFEATIRASYDFSSCVEVFDLVRLCAPSVDCSVCRTDPSEVAVRSLAAFCTGVCFYVDKGMTRC